MQKFPRRWNKLDCFNFLQRKIIINSIAYYELDNPVLSDKQYDELCRQLVSLQDDIDLNLTQYGYCMNGFDGSTGFDLYEKLNSHDKDYLMKLAMLGLGKVKVKEEKVTKKKRKGGLF